jgi:hypothetical protein
MFLRHLYTVTKFLLDTYVNYLYRWRQTWQYYEAKTWKITSKGQSHEKVYNILTWDSGYLRVAYDVSNPISVIATIEKESLLAKLWLQI